MVVAGLTDSGADGRWAESLLAGDSLAAPHLMPVEAANILRRAALAGDISADGMTWTKIGVVAGTAPAMIYVDIGAGADGAITTPATAKLSSLDVCP